MLDQPLVSCLCITENRSSFLKAAIHYFSLQTYINKELIIVYLAEDLETKALISEASRPDILSIAVENRSKYSLGEMRNLSIINARGDYICTWDDDDIYHQDRISVMMGALLSSGKMAAVLTQLTMYDSFTQKAYLSIKRLFWEQSLFCNKHHLIEKNLWYLPINRGEDTPLVGALFNEMEFLCRPELYVYCIHQFNTSGSALNSRQLRFSYSLGKVASAHVSRLYAQAFSVTDYPICWDSEFARRIIFVGRAISLGLDYSEVAQIISMADSSVDYKSHNYKLIASLLNRSNDLTRLITYLDKLNREPSSQEEKSIDLDDLFNHETELNTVCER